VIGYVAHASQDDLDDALTAVEDGFNQWRTVPAIDRQRILMRAVELMRSRSEVIANCLTLEQGKPLVQARGEVEVAAGMVQWYAEQARRIYGRLVPAPLAGTEYQVRKEPIGPCLLLSPWNVPVILAARKIGGALASGCSCIVKPPEETPGAVAMLVECFIDAGLPRGAINLVLGIPEQISEHLIDSDVIRKISFTGSVSVGKQLARLASTGLKRLTLELGGHSPVIVFDDVELDACVRQLVTAKFRNAGQLCHAPTRFFVHRSIYSSFVDKFADAASKLKMGNGLDETTELGPLANHRRLAAMETLVQKTMQKGTLATGGHSEFDQGFFFAPTVFADVQLDAFAMQNEPFGPVALMRSFDSPEEVIQNANATRFGLGSYVFTDSARLQHKMINELSVGSIAINSTVSSVAEAPFGGVRDSGYGYESGEEGIESYIHTKFVHQTYDS
jgi:succinate-semialdehyde dehydrogenase/glutarate-semialdehyde dehydrogenase